MRFLFGSMVLVSSVLASFAAQARTGQPVVLVSGTFSGVTEVSFMANYLRSKGREVYPMALEKMGLASTDESVAALTQKIDEVRKATGVQKVDLVGWSQGSHISRRYVQKGGVDNVNTLVMLGSPTYEWSWSTFLYRLTGGNCLGMENCKDQQASSNVLQEMNNGPDMPMGIKVFNVWTLADRIVTPNRTVSILKDGNTGTQFPLQDVCPARPTGHFGLVKDPVSWRIVDTALNNQKAKPAADCLLPAFML